MPAPLNPEVRAAIKQDIRDGKSRNQIARDHSVSGSTVGKIAKHLEANGELAAPAFDRAHTKRATASKQVDLAARRAELGGLLMQDAFDLRERMWGEQYQAVVVPRKGGGASTEIVAVPTSAADFRNYLTSIGIAVDKVRVLTEVDSNAQEAVSLLGTLVGDIRARRTTVVPDAAG